MPCCSFPITRETVPPSPCRVICKSTPTHTFVHGKRSDRTLFSLYLTDRHANENLISTHTPKNKNHLEMENIISKLSLPRFSFSIRSSEFCALLTSFWYIMVMWRTVFKWYHYDIHGNRTQVVPHFQILYQHHSHPPLLLRIFMLSVGMAL